MPEHPTTAMTAAQFLAAASVDEEVYTLRPDYRALLLVAEGLFPQAPHPGAESVVAALTAEAETSAQRLLASSAAQELPHISAWRTAYRDFGAKPSRFRSSVESLLRRAESGMPQVNLLTDAYNAVSVLHQVPIGGEDLDAYCGPAQLVRATGDEDFDTVAGGEPIIENPAPGEVIWRDDAGVTCRRWNWRQGRRTALREDTHRAVFILDALEPMSDAALLDAGDALTDALGHLGPDVAVSTRLITP